MFNYMFTIGNEISICDVLKKTIRKKRNLYSYKYRFDYFIEKIKESFETKNIYRPISLHFNTHVNTAYRDITDENGNIIVNRVYRLSDLYKAIRQIKSELGYAIGETEKVHLNKTKSKNKYVPTSRQKKKIKQIYQKDIEIYSNAISFR